MGVGRQPHVAGDRGEVLRFAEQRHRGPLVPRFHAVTPRNTFTRWMSFPQAIASAMASASARWSSAASRRSSRERGIGPGDRSGEPILGLQRAQVGVVELGASPSSASSTRAMVSLRPCAACMRTWSASASARRRGRLRACAEGIEVLQHRERAVLVALGERRRRKRAIGDQQVVGEAAAFDHVEAIGEQRLCLRHVAPLGNAPAPGSKRIQAGDHAAAAVAFGVQQRGEQRRLPRARDSRPRGGSARRSCVRTHGPGAGCLRRRTAPVVR